MKITNIRITPVLVADPPLLNVIGVHQPYVPRSIIEVHTESGVVGLGETYGDEHILGWLQQSAAILLGTSIFDLNLLSSRVATAIGRSEAQGAGLTRLHGSNLTGSMETKRAVTIVVGAFEVALLDAQGKTLGLPVHALLGGKLRDQVDFAAYLFYKWAEHPNGLGEKDDWGSALNSTEIVAQAKRMVDSYGFKSLKLKGGVMPPDQEVAAIKALRLAFPDHGLRIDPNTGWSVLTSLKVAAELDGFLEYFEDPTPSLSGMAELAKQIKLPLATNMCVTGFEHIPESLEQGSVQIILSDHHFWGGLRATQKLSGICETWGLSLSMHSNSHLGISLAAMTHLGSVLPTLQYACDTHRPWQTEDVVIGKPLPIIDGAIRVPNAPGLGVELDQDALARLHQRWQNSDVRIRDDEAAMRVVDPGWAPKIPRF